MGVPPKPLGGSRIRLATVATQAQRREATAATVLEAAVSLFARRGYDETTIEQVAEAAGVTKCAVYYHFDGKKALFEAVFDRVHQRLADVVLTKAGQASAPVERLKQGCRTFLDCCTRDSARQVVLLDGLASWAGRRGGRSMSATS